MFQSDFPHVCKIIQCHAMYVHPLVPPTPTARTRCSTTAITSVASQTAHCHTVVARLKEAIATFDML